MELASGGELGMGLDDAGRNHGADEVALAGWPGGEQACEAELAEGGEHGLDRAMGARADNLEGLRGIDEGAAGELSLEQVDCLVAKVGEVGEGGFPDPAWSARWERRRSLER
ncbi:MAG: hypothetical protein OXE50_16340 [Chloroflexi bacterium]|nr:hypothetical protein [Chloroflexota bacterium]